MCSTAGPDGCSLLCYAARHWLHAHVLRDAGGVISLLQTPLMGRLVHLRVNLHNNCRSTTMYGRT